MKSQYDLFLCLCGVLLSAALLGCSFLAYTPIDIFPPSIEIQYLEADNNTALFSQEEARTYIIGKLNATQYGLVLKEKSHGGAGSFEYSEMYIALKEKTSKRLWFVKTMYMIAISNTCSKASDSLSIQKACSKEYFFTREEEARKVFVALLSLGAKPC